MSSSSFSNGVGETDAIFPFGVFFFLVPLRTINKEENLRSKNEFGKEIRREGGELSGLEEDAA